jgi:hypothetical protein
VRVRQRSSTAETTTMNVIFTLAIVILHLAAYSLMVYILWRYGVNGRRGRRAAPGASRAPAGAPGDGSSSPSRPARRRASPHGKRLCAYLLLLLAAVLEFTLVASLDPLPLQRAVHPAALAVPAVAAD